ATAVGGDGLMISRFASGESRLSEADPSGQVRRDLGAVDFVAMGGWLGAWRSHDGRAIFGVLGKEKFGLFSSPRSAAGEALAAAAASLGPCSFDPALIHG